MDLQKTYQTSLDNIVKQDVTTTKTTGGGLFSSAKTEKVTDIKLVESKNKIVEGSQTNINNLFSQISTVTSGLQNLEKQSLENSQEIMRLESDNSKGEIGTFKFVAEAFGLKIENAVRIFIILIVIVFDPLAVCLVIAYNSMIKKIENEVTQKPQQRIQNIIEKPLDTFKVLYENLHKNFKRGTKVKHNPHLADPNL
jgi:hypothetical protein